MEEVEDGCVIGTVTAAGRDELVDAALKQDRIVESLDTEIIGLVPAGSVPTRVRPVQDIVGHQKEGLQLNT